MASGGSGKRPPRFPHGPNGQNVRGAEQRPRSGQAQANRHKASAQAGDIFWRRLRQRIRAVWRWMVVRTVRSLTSRWKGKVDGVDHTTFGGDVRQFPGSK